MFDNENILGPFEAQSGLRLLAINNDALYLIELGFGSLIKYSINLQLPLFFIGHFEKLKSTNIQELLKSYKYKKIKIDTNLKVKIERSKFWKHKIHIKRGDIDVKWNILDREAVKYYEIILSDRLYSNTT